MGLLNNNPGNIRIVDKYFKGEVVPSQDSRLKQFTGMAHGYRAMFMMLHRLNEECEQRTIFQMIDKWSLAHERDTRVYAEAVAYSVGKSPNERIYYLSRNLMVGIVAEMSRIENGVPPVMEDIYAGWELFCEL